ncbi:MAG: xylulokinase [Oscillospiraceae bacterium]|nr:xylulokinase [Oscillospiraceae bacterium]
MAELYCLGIDIGTSGTKAALFTQNGKAVLSKTEEYPLYQPRNGWAEQDPLDWWHAVQKSVSGLISESGVAPADIKSIGLSGQMHGLVMLDADGNLLRRAIIWCDQRTARECEAMNALIGKQRLIEITANPALTGFTASKILWVRENEPDIYERCAHILLPKDYIRYMLTGEFATDVSDASGMQLMDVPKRTWSLEILNKLGISGDLLPKIYESPDQAGVVCAKSAGETGLRAGTVVAGGAGDNAAAAIGMGVAKPGSAFMTIGSSGVIYAVTDKVSIDLAGRVNTLCASVPGGWTVMSCTQAAGLSLKWFRDNFCLKEILEAEKLGMDVYDFMGGLAEKVGIGAQGLLFLPYLMGERAPHPDSLCRGVFFGLSAIHGSAHMTRAIMEGVAYSQWECLDVFAEMGVTAGDMMICGGGGRSRLWRQILADTLGCTISSARHDEGPALGAAILGAVAAGLYDSVGEACEQIVVREKLNEPIEANRVKYKGYFDLFKRLYVNLRSDFEILAVLQ